ncbi:hypothetical protein Tco_0308799 [Tanacetum coccineum]
MASLDHRLNPLFSIKECMTCGALYTADFCCSKGGLEDKILVSKHPQNCATCGDPVDGLYCRSCAFMRSAHIGYNCPPKAPIISNPEQYINDLPQTLPSVHSTCNYEDENSFTYDSKLNSFNDSPSVLTYPPQLQFETYLCELCGNNAHYGYDCPPQFPLIYDQEPWVLMKLFNPQQYTANHLILNVQKEFLNSQNKLMKQMTSICDMIPICHDDDEDYTIAITPILSTKEPIDSLIMEDEEKKETAAQSFIPYWNSSMIDDEEARDNFLKDVYTFLRKFSRIPFGVTPKVILIAWESFCEIKDALMDKQYQQKDIQELMSKLLEDV